VSEVKLSFLEAGYTRHPEATVLAGGSPRSVRFGSSVAVIEHPRHGVILFDTGYSERFYAETRRFPNKIYALITPVHVGPEDSAAAQLRARGISAGDVRTVVLSHFHADHVAGAADFPRARYVYQFDAYLAVRDRGTAARIAAGFLPGLLPADFDDRSRPLFGAEARAGLGLGSFDVGWDLCGDGSVVLVDLPGHARGHSGLIVREGNGQTNFLVADACWTSRSYRERRMPSRVAGLIMDDWRDYRHTLDGLHDFAEQHPAVRIVPCHCAEATEPLLRHA
jgi:glyoxylase-like metal-dependent hydrolase (beta-lactamase superfamily II)